MYRIVYVIRARCDCGFIWTTPGSPSVICQCGTSSIIEGVPTVPSLPFTEDEFRSAAASEIGADPSQVTIEAA